MTALTLHASMELLALMALEASAVVVHPGKLDFCAISTMRALQTLVMQTPYVKQVQSMVHSLVHALKGTKVQTAQKISMNAFKVNICDLITF